MSQSYRENEEIIAGWIEFTQRRNKKTGDLSSADYDSISDADCWAMMVVEDLLFEDYMRVLDIINGIALESSDEWVLENLGAGPIETILHQHAREVAPILFSMASRNSNLRIALESVWASGIDKDAWAILSPLLSKTN